MRKGLKAIADRSVKPFVQWYLRRPRTYSYRDIRVRITPGVFHPGLFFSTKQLVDFLDGLELSKKEILEMGCGSGLVSIFAAKKGAQVCCVDIAPAAVAVTRENATVNGVKLETLLSDLFANVPQRRFDLIAVNPPYYPKQPLSIEAHAWYAGEDHAYFRRFFQQAKAFVHPASRVLMVLSDECDLDAIRSIAVENGWQWEIAATNNHFFETGYIIRLLPPGEETP